MIIKKRQLLLATLIIALGAAVFINWYYTKPTAKSAGAEPEASTSEQVREGANLGDARYVISSEIAAEDTAAQAKASEYFDAAKLRRQNAHDEASKALSDIIKDSSSSSDTLEAAQSALKELTDALTLESDMENLIEAKVGCKNLVIINGGAVEIIVENGSLDDVALIKIKEIAVKQTGYGVEKISITEMEY